MGLGTLLPLGNPKVIGFYVALLPAVLDVAALSWSAALQLSGVIIAVWGLVLIGYAAAAEHAKKLVSGNN